MYKTYKIYSRHQYRISRNEKDSFICGSKEHDTEESEEVFAFSLGTNDNIIYLFSKSMKEIRIHGFEYSCNIYPLRINNINNEYCSLSSIKNNKFLSGAPIPSIGGTAYTNGYSY